MKDTFGTMVDTVVTQHEEIGKLNTTVDKVSDESKRSRKKIVEITSSKLKDILRQHMKLHEDLLISQAKFKNFAYNIQGYDDPTVEATVVPNYDLRSMDIIIEESDPPSLFPTEEGAIPSETFGVQSTARSRDKKKNSPKYVVVNGNVVEYHSIRPFSLPPTPSSRWKWAMRRVLQGIRRKKLHLSFANVKIEKNQTISGKLELLDYELFNLSVGTEKKFNTLQNYTEEIAERAALANTRVLEVIASQEEEKSFVREKIDSLDSHLTTFEKETNTAISAIQSQSNSIQSILEDVTTLKQQMINSQQYLYSLQDNHLNKLKHEISAIDIQIHELCNDLLPIFPVFKLQDLLNYEGSIYSREKMANEYLTQSNHLHDSWNKALKHERDLVSIREKLNDIRIISLAHLKQFDMLENDLKSFEELQNHFPMHSHQLKSKLEDIAKFSRSHASTLEDFKNLIRLHDDSFNILQSKIFSAEEKMTDEVHRLQAQFNIHKDRFEQVHLHVERLAGRNSDMDARLFKFENDIVEMNRQFYVLNSLNKGKLSIDTLGEDVLSCRKLLDELKDQASQRESYRGVDVNNGYDDSLHDGQSQASIQSEHSLAPNHFAIDNEDQHELAQGLSENYEHIADVEVMEMKQQSNEVYHDINNESERNPPRKEANIVSNTDQNINDHQNAGKFLDEKLQSDPLESHPPSKISPRSNQGARESSGRKKREKIGQGKSETSENLESQIIRVIETKLPELLKSFGGKLHPLSLNSDFSQLREEKGIPFIKDLAEKETPNSRLKESITKAIQQAEQYENDNPPVSSSVPDDLQNPPRRRRQSSALLGSFVDYETQKSVPILVDPIMSKSRPKSPQVATEISLPGGYNNVLGQNPFSSPFDASPLIRDISNLREELLNIHNLVNQLSEEKVTKEELKESYFELMRDQRRKEIKQESSRSQNLEDLQKSVQEITKDLTALKSNHVVGLDSVKSDLETMISKILTKLVSELSESHQESVLSTKGLCLGCGRPSNIRTQPLSRAQSPPFLPALNSNIVPGPDIYRAGFKMPGRSNSPPAILDSSQPQQSIVFSLEDHIFNQASSISSVSQNNEVPLVMRNKVMTFPESQQREVHPYMDFHRDFDSLNPTVIPLATPASKLVQDSSIATEDVNQGDHYLHLTMPSVQQNQLYEGDGGMYPSSD